MKIYTKTGDTGQTGLIGGIRVSKAHSRIEAYGTVDELNSFVGQSLTLVSEQKQVELLNRIQHELFAIGAELASTDGSSEAASVGSRQIERLEFQIDQTETYLPALKHFIFPGGSPLAAAFHVCRSVCRRAERRAVELATSPGESVSNEIIVYLNRLSDLFFVLARAANQSAGRADQVWHGRDTDS